MSRSSPAGRVGGNNNKSASSGKRASGDHVRGASCMTSDGTVNDCTQ
jgi:hypothetical protein